MILDSLSISNPKQPIVVKATCDGIVEEVFIDSDGICSGSCTGGELNMADGTWTTQITWVSPPDSGVDITITYAWFYWVQTFGYNYYHHNSN